MRSVPVPTWRRSFWRPRAEATSLRIASSRLPAMPFLKFRRCDDGHVGARVNFHVTVLKILVSYPDGFAAMEDLKRDMAILATSGRDWTERTRRLGGRVPALDIFSQGLIDRT